MRRDKEIEKDTSDPSQEIFPEIDLIPSHN